MARTTQSAVEAIIEVDGDAIPDISPFIDDAALVVEEDLAVLDTLSESRLELIERYLTAHFIAIRDPRVASEKAGPVSASYQYKLGDALKGTTYGQAALALDSTGTLAALGEKRKTASISYLGPDIEELT